MEVSNLSKAREKLVVKDGQAHEAVLAMLKKFDGDGGSATPSVKGDLPLNPTVNKNKDGESSPDNGNTKDGQFEAALEMRRNRRMAKFHPSAEEVSENMEASDEVNNDKATWRLSAMGPKIITLERAPWEEEEAPLITEAPSVERSESQGLEDIIEDEEDSETLTSSNHRPSVETRSKLLTPPIENTQPSSPSIYFSFSKFSPRSPSNHSTTPKSPALSTTASSPVSEVSIPKTSPKSPKSRAGLKKIFLGTLRPRKREDSEPLSPNSSLSSTATTPSLPTPTIRISSPIHPRRMDGSPMFEQDTYIGAVSPIETKYKLPELRLSRADWGEWGRQIAERL